MAVALPFAAGLLIWLHLLRRGRCWRRAIVHAALAWGTLIVGITELLSAATQLAFVPLTATWAAITFLLAAGYACRVPRVRAVRARDPETEHWRSQRHTSYFATMVRWRRSLPWGCAASIAAIALIVGITAILSPPNTFDSLTYHMPRVMHWIAQQSVRHFPAANDRQLWSPPWSEFVIAHFQILSGGDRFAGLVQFGSMLIGLVAVSLVAGELGAPRHIQLLAALVAATIPMGILQASGTQTDWNVACWIACFNLFVLDLCRTTASASRVRGESEHTEWVAIISAGAALGLALLTKGTAILFCAPCGLWLAWVFVCRRRWAAAPRLAVLLLLAMVLNAPHFARNLRQFGSPLSASEPSAWLRNESFDPRFVVSNLLRGAALHLHTRSHVLDNILVVEPIKQVHKWLGIDINDPRSTYMAASFQIPKFSGDEDYAGNPIHLLLMTFAIVALIASAIRGSGDRMFTGYVVCIAAMAILFAAALKWQVWGSRLQFPIFVCGSPLIAILLWRRLSARGTAIWATVLVLFAVPFLLTGIPRHLLGAASILTTSRDDLYFRKIADDKSAYQEAARRIRLVGAHDIGLAADYNAPEYVLWAELNPSGTGLTKMRNVAPLQPALITWNWPSPAPPEMILTTHPIAASELSIAGRSYVRTWSRGVLAMYEPAVAETDTSLAARSTIAREHTEASGLAEMRAP